jgi:hypothetical protein
MSFINGDLPNAYGDNSGLLGVDICKFYIFNASAGLDITRIPHYQRPSERAVTLCVRQRDSGTTRIDRVPKRR